MRSILFVIGCGLLGSCPQEVAAQARSVDDAVQKGAAYLQKMWNNGGAGNQHKVGGAGLAGLAMLEAGVKADDTAVQAVAKMVREEALALTETYHIALAILFLDKLNDPKDVPVIQLLGVRLYAGLTSAGKWTYSCWDPVPEAEVNRLRAALRENQLKTEPQPDPAPPADPFQNPGGAKPSPPAAPATGKLHPEVARIYLLVVQALRSRGRNAAGGDNSNTQFGMIALWVASRHGVPAQDAFLAIELGFLRGQNARDGGWGYHDTASSTVAMTCAGLLGLAIGQGSREQRQLSTDDKRPIPPSSGKEDDPFFNPKNKDGDRSQPKDTGLARTRAMDAGLLAIGRVLAATKPNGGQNNLDNFVGLGDVFYMLWSVERVGVAYGLDTIGNVDWYEWGCSYLLPSQGADGAWASAGAGHNYGAAVDTAFALLFLTKANSVRDLTSKVKGKVKDPGTSELKGGGAAPPLFAPPPKESERPISGGSKPDPGRSPSVPGDTTPPPLTGGFTLPRFEPPAIAIVKPNESRRVCWTPAMSNGCSDSTKCATPVDRSLPAASPWPPGSSRGSAGAKPARRSPSG